MVTFSGYANKVGLIENSSSEIPPMVGVIAQDGPQKPVVNGVK